MGSNHKADLYYRRKYNHSLREIKAKRRRQKNRCAICKRPPKKLPLAVDHWHKLAKLKVKTEKTSSGKWRAYNTEFELYGYTLREKSITYTSRNRRKAKKSVQKKLLRKSVRGLLCWACNSGLRKWLDNPVLLRRAGKYLAYHQSGGK